VIREEPTSEITHELFSLVPHFFQLPLEMVSLHHKNLESEE